MGVLSEAESIDTFQNIKSDLALSTYGSHIIEIAERLLPEEQPNPHAYHLLVSVLTLLNTNPRQLWIRSFEVKLMTTLGFWSLDQIQADESVKKILDDLQKKDWPQLSELEVTKSQALELERVLRYHIERVLDGKLKSLDVMKDLKD